MKTLETNDWMILNNIIYKIYTTENVDTMRELLLEQLRMVMDYDSADFFLADREEPQKLVNPILYNCEEETVVNFKSMEHENDNVLNGKSMVYRETDMLPDEKRTNSEYFRKVYRPNNWNYSIQLVLGMNRKFLGVITFYRTLGKDNFQYDDIMILDMLKDHLSYRLYQGQKTMEDAQEKLTVTEATEKYSLTKREHVILQHLMAGKENSDICDELAISVNTLKKHILNIYRKLEIRNRVQLFKMIKEKE